MGTFSTWIWTQEELPGEKLQYPCRIGTHMQEGAGDGHSVLPSHLCGLAEKSVPQSSTHPLCCALLITVLDIQLESEKEKKETRK